MDVREVFEAFRELDAWEMGRAEALEAGILLRSAAEITVLGPRSDPTENFFLDLLVGAQGALEWLELEAFHLPKRCRQAF